MIDQDQTFRISTDVVVTPLDGEKESVLLHLGTKKYYTLNETGVRIWHLLCDGYTIAGITKKICSEYDIPPADAEKSIASLTSSLIKEELLLTG